jgi:hypothetical protein
MRVTYIVLFFFSFYLAWDSWSMLWFYYDQIYPVLQKAGIGTRVIDWVQTYGKVIGSVVLTFYFAVRMTLR